MATVHLIEGPVGAGKSTFAAALAVRERALHIDLDEWYGVLFRPDRPAQGLLAWYGERKRRCIDMAQRLASSSARVGTSVVLELGLLTRSEREAFYGWAGGEGLAVQVVVLDAPREVRRERVRERNRTRGGTFKIEIPDEIFELASDRWEPPDAAECEIRSIRLVSTHA